MVIATQVSSPELGIPLAIASHVAADLFPHWDTATHSKKKGRYKLFRDSIIDVVLSFVLPFVLVWALFPDTSYIYVFFMILASQLLDWLTAPYYFFGIRKPPFIWVYKVQVIFDNRMDKPWGIINQVILLSVLLGIAYLGS